MTLRQKQSRFASLVPRLIDFAIASGYEIVIGEVYRSPEEAKRLAALGLGSLKSLHISKLAIDLLLFKDGKYLTKTEDYAHVGLYWEELSNGTIDTVWGGAFGDGNHFSIAHEGRK